MNLTEKAAYIKGLMEGLAPDANSKEGKLFAAIIDLLEDVTLTVADIEDDIAEVNDIIDDLDEDLADLEEYVYDDEDEDDDFITVECDECGEEIILEDDEILEDEIKCPACGAMVPIEWDLEGCDCGCCDDDE